MKWTVELSKPALKQLGKINKTEREHIWRFIKETLPNQHNPRQTGRALQGSLKGFWRYRVGNYLLICQIKDNEVLILVLEIDTEKTFIKILPSQGLYTRKMLAFERFGRLITSMHYNSLCAYPF